MRNKSKKLQDFACSGDEHTAKSVIDRIMFHLVERQGEGPDYLFGSDPDNDDPMGRALRAEQVPPRPNQRERLVQVENFLRGTNISPEIREAHLRSIQGKKIGECHTNYFCKIYTQLWVTGMAGHIKTVLTDFCRENPRLLEAWQGNQLAELLLLSDEDWLDLFRFKTNNSAGDVSLNCCGYKGATLLSTLASDNPLHPTYFRGQDGSTMRSLELLWILMWAHLSADILKMVRGLFSGASDSAREYPQLGLAEATKHGLTIIVR